MMEDDWAHWTGSLAGTRGAVMMPPSPSYSQEMKQARLVAALGGEVEAPGRRRRRRCPSRRGF